MGRSITQYYVHTYIHRLTAVAATLRLPLDSSDYTILEGEYMVVEGKLMDALPDNRSQHDFITLRDPVAANSKFAQHQADSLRRQVGFFVPPVQKSVD